MLEILEHLLHIGKDEETAPGARLVVQIVFKILRVILTLRTQNLTGDGIEGVGDCFRQYGEMSPMNIGNIGKDEQTAPDPNEAVQNF